MFCTAVKPQECVKYGKRCFHVTKQVRARQLVFLHATIRISKGKDL